MVVVVVEDRPITSSLGFAAPVYKPGGIGPRGRAAGSLFQVFLITSPALPRKPESSSL